MKAGSLTLIACIVGCATQSHVQPSNKPARESVHVLDYNRPFTGSRVEVHGGRIDPNDFEAARKLCDATDICFQLATLLEKRGDILGARDAMERDCEYRQDARVCELLARHYVNRDWPEPLPERGTKLLEWACSITHACSSVEDI